MTTDQHIEDHFYHEWGTDANSINIFTLFIGSTNPADTAYVTPRCLIEV